MVVNRSEMAWGHNWWEAWVSPRAQLASGCGRAAVGAAENHSGTHCHTITGTYPFTSAQRLTVWVYRRAVQTSYPRPEARAQSAAAKGSRAVGRGVRAIPASAGMVMGPPGP